MLEGAPRRLGEGPIRPSDGPLARASDERLTTEMRRGNQAAFEVAYGRYARGMLALCHHMLRSKEDAEEALQDSFAAVWTDLQRSDRPAPELLKPWLYAIARHRCLSMLRSRNLSTVELEELASASGLAKEVGERADVRAVLADLGDLPEEQKTALVLSELAGLSHGDIAPVLGRKTSAVKALVFQARRTLADWREAREVTCAEIRDQLGSLRGGALRRRALRRHLQTCPSCRAFRLEQRAQRRRLRIFLPALPSFGLKRNILAALGLGGKGEGAAGGLAAISLGGGAIAQLGSAVLAVVAVGVLAGDGPIEDERRRAGTQPKPRAGAPAREQAPLAALQVPKRARRATSALAPSADGRDGGLPGRSTAGAGPRPLAGTAARAGRKAGPRADAARGPGLHTAAGPGAQTEPRPKEKPNAAEEPKGGKAPRAPKAPTAPKPPSAPKQHKGSKAGPAPPPPTPTPKEPKPKKGPKGRKAPKPHKGPKAAPAPKPTPPPKKPKPHKGPKYGPAPKPKPPPPPPPPREPKPKKGPKAEEGPVAAPPPAPAPKPEKGPKGVAPPKTH